MKTYRVNEIFYTLQGEGFHTGTPMVFVRFSGCNRVCAFCDTDFSASVPMTADDILAECRKYVARKVVLTGGEPLLQVDVALVEALHAAGYRIHVETNGSLPVPDGIDWVTCSPKDGPLGIDPSDADELKLVYTGQPEAELEDMRRGFPDSMPFLQPCSGANIPETVTYIKDHPWWRLSLQTHKLIDIP